MILALYQYSRNFAPVNVQNVLGENYAASNTGYGDQFNNLLYYYNNVDPNAPIHSSLPSVPASAAAGSVAPAPNILDHGGGSDGRAPQGRTPGTFGHPFASTFGGSTSTSGGLLGGLGFGDFSSPNLEDQSQAWDSTQKDLGLFSLFGASIAAPFSAIAGEVGRHSANKAFDAYGNISFAQDISRPDFAFGSPDSILRDRKASVEKAVNGETLTKQDKQNIENYTAYTKEAGVPNYIENSHIGPGGPTATPMTQANEAAMRGLTNQGLMDGMMQPWGGILGQKIDQQALQQRNNEQRAARTAEVQAAHATAVQAAWDKKQADLSRASSGSDRNPGTPDDPSGYYSNYGGFSGDQAGDGSSSSSSKIVCTAMNKAYGFGGFRQIIWLNYAKEHLTPSHEKGYHTLFQPLVDFAYGGKGFLRRRVKSVLEHIARHRTKDIWLEMKGKRRDPMGRVERAILEPVCAFVGRLKCGK